MKEKRPKPKKTLWEKRLIAKRILLGSGLAFAIGWSTAMASETIYQNKINTLQEDKNNIYEQYMQSDEFKMSSAGQVINLALAYSGGTIDYDTFKNELDKVYAIETADKLLETSTNELKDEIAQIDQQIIDTIQHQKSNPIDIGSIALMGASVAAMAGSAIPFWYYEYKTVAKSKMLKADENENQNTL